MQILYLILLLLSYGDSKYVIIPLTKYNYLPNENEKNIISKIFSNIYYTKLNIGSPSQSLAAFINTSSVSNIGIINKFCDKKFYIENIGINKDYKYLNSSTFKNYKNENMLLGTKDFLITDKIKFYSDFELKTEINVDNISLLYNPNNEGYIIDDVGIDFIIEREKKTTCAYIGFQLGFQRNNVYNNLLDQLKNKKIISNTVFSFIEVNPKNELYKKNGIDYLLILGEELHDIININNIGMYISDKYNKNKIKEKNKLNDYIVNEGYYYFVWKITCSDIYIKINNNYKDNLIYLENMQNIYINQDFGLISGTAEYRNFIEQNFFNQYENNSKCSRDILNKNTNGNYYYYFVCDDDVDLSKFPSLFFKSKILQYEYSLEKEDLFIRDKDKIYFLIIFDLRLSDTWKLGKIFLDKYFFSYNYEARTISFYNENLLLDETNNKKSNNNFNLIIIMSVIIFLALLALILGFICGKNINNLRKKNKAYELDSEIKNNLIKDNKNNSQENKENFSINI